MFENEHSCSELLHLTVFFGPFGLVHSEIATVKRGVRCGPGKPSACSSAMQQIIPGLKIGTVPAGLSISSPSLSLFSPSLSLSPVLCEQEATSLPISCQGGEQRSRNYPLQN